MNEKDMINRLAFKACGIRPVITEREREELKARAEAAFPGMVVADCRDILAIIYDLEAREERR